VCSLQRIATFIKQRPLGNKDSLDIPQISNFGFAAWDLISAIYNSGWDKLAADNNSRTFCQCVVSQFNRGNPADSKAGNISCLENISKIPPPIPLKVLANNYIEDRLFASTTASIRHWLLIYCKVERDEVVNCSCILLPYFCYRRLLNYSLATVSQATTSSTIKHPTNNKQKS